MRSWLILLGGLLLWAAHFFLAYGLGEFAAQDAAVRIAIVAATLLAVAAELLLLRHCLRQREADFAGWQYRIGAVGAAIGGIAILWQGLPALFPN
jgi:hypothetical protein